MDVRTAILLPVGLKGCHIQQKESSTQTPAGCRARDKFGSVQTRYGI